MATYRTYVWRSLCILGLFAFTSNSWASKPEGWSLPGTDNGLVGGGYRIPDSNYELPANTGSLLIRSLYDLETKQDSGAIGRFIGLSQPKMVEARLHLEYELRSRTDIDLGTKKRLLVQFDRTIGATAIGTRGDTFSLDSRKININTMEPDHQRYLLALSKGDTAEAADIRTKIIGGRVGELSTFGYDTAAALNFANTELALTTELVAAEAKIPEATINIAVFDSLKDQGIPPDISDQLAARLVAMGSNHSGIGTALDQSPQRYTFPSTEVDLPDFTASSYSGGGGLAGWIDALSAHWDDLREDNLIVSAVAPKDGAQEDEAEAGNQESNKKSRRAMSPLDRVNEQNEELLERWEREYIENDSLSVKAIAGIPDRDSDEGNTGATGAMDLGDDEFTQWTEDIKLRDTDLIYASLARWFGGPIDAIRNAYFSNGSFNENFVSSGITNAGVPTGSFSSLTIITFIVLVFSTWLASIYFFYGMYKGAEEGTFFGRQHDTSMTVGRMIMSLGGNVPIPVLYGLTPVQVFLILSIFGSLAVSAAASQFMISWMVSRPMIEPIPTKNESFVSNVLKSQLCMATLRDADLLRESEKGDGYFRSSFNYNGVVEPENYDRKVSSGVLSGLKGWLRGGGVNEELDLETVRKVYSDMNLNKGWDIVTRYRFGAEGRCGTFYIREGTSDSFVSFQNMKPRGPNAAALTENIDVDSHSKWIRTIKNRRDELVKNSTEKLFEELRKISDAAVSIEKAEKGGISAAREVIKQAYSSESKYYSTLVANTQQLLGSTPDPTNVQISNIVSELGMGSLGAIYWFIEHKQKQQMSFFDFTGITSSSGSQVTVASDDDGFLAFFFNAVDEDVQERMRRLQSEADSIIGNPGLVMAKQRLQSAVISNSVVEEQEAVSVLNNMILQEDWLADMDNWHVSPIERVRHFGNLMQATLGTVSIGLIMAESVTVAIAGGPLGDIFAMRFFANILKRAFEIFSSISSALFLAAFVASNIVPAMPYVMFTAAVVGLLVRYYSMLVAAPVWWMQKMHLTGGDLTGHSATGWSMYFQMILQAPMIAIGFVGGIGLNWVAGHIVNVTFLPSQALQGAGGFNITSYIGTVLVYSGLQVWVCYKSFSLTWEIPAITNALIGSAFGAPGSDENEGRQLIGGIVQQGVAPAGGALARMRGADPEHAEEGGDAGSEAPDNANSSNYNAEREGRSDSSSSQDSQAPTAGAGNEGNEPEESETSSSQDSQAPGAGSGDEGKKSNDKEG